MRKVYFLLMCCFFGSHVCAQEVEEQPVVASVLAWHAAAAAADYDAYFALMTADAVFIGTDATERWTKPEFQAYAKPHFEKGKAWTFKPIVQHVNLEKGQTVAWLDELLQTDMEICRGTAILKLVDGQWKIAHYTLSMTVPNDLAKEVIHLKSQEEKALMLKLNTLVQP